MNKYLSFIFMLLSLPLFLTAQVGGDNVYEFLNMSNSARTTSLGGSLLSVRDDDLSLAYGNPALLSPLVHQQLTFNYNFHMAGISNGYAAYGHHIKPWATTFHAGIQYLNYGTFDATDVFGQINGSFKAAEYAITIGAARQLYKNLTLGSNIKFISSQFEGYNSVGLAVDFAAYYQDSTGRFSAALVVKNVGGQLSTYREGNREKLPFEIQASISRRLKHLPFRFTITYNNLNRWNILYDDPNEEDNSILLGGEEPQERSQFSINVDNFFRHLVFGGEFLFGKKDNFRVRVGYSHFQRKELSVNNFRSLAGFSFGLGLKISKFRIDYGRAFYHIAGGLNHFSISTNLQEFKK